MLWTEPLFTLLSALTLLILQRVWSRRRLTPAGLLALAPSVSAAGALRYVGSVLVVLVAVVVAGSLWHRGRARPIALEARAAWTLLPLLAFGVLYLVVLVASELTTVVSTPSATGCSTPCSPR